MATLELLPVGEDTQQWSIWSTAARIVVTDPATLPAARRVVDSVLAAVDAACNRFHAYSELCRLDLTPGAPTQVSPLLAELIDTALRAAESTGGAVDPTIGIAMESLGYDRDLALVPADGAAVPFVVRRAPGWQQVELRGQEVTIPPGVRLDLGATGKAFAADLCATLVASSCGTGVLVSLGGDIATAGDGPTGGWRVLVADGPGQPATTVRLAAGMAMATSSTISRRWRRGGRLLHHVLDPRTCLPVDPVWRTVSVVAQSCVDANTQSTAALVRGLAAPARLTLPARFVAADGSVRTAGGWPKAGDRS
ncbi:MAG TPA: FAD:protein FMN transferase [Pseudonocardiaceae bacterium]|nr:FAD:protein FMN transferase [Pseudonocardiaceae bacterium]